MLVSFTSGVLTTKSFARRNGYEINAVLKHQKAQGLIPADTRTDNAASADPHWREAVQPLREETPDAVPLPRKEEKV